MYLINREESIVLGMTLKQVLYTSSYMFDNLTASNVAIVLICLVASITIHESMHAYIGFRLGDTTAMEKGRVSFNPLHHIDPVMTVLLPLVTLLLFHFPFLAAKPVPFNPYRVKYNEYGTALIAAAGPLSNLALAFAAALVLRFADVGATLGNALVFFVELNVALFIFNMIPIPPLDGSRVLYAFAPEPVQELMQQIEPYGFFLIFVLIFWGGAGGIIANLNSFVLNLLP